MRVIYSGQTYDAIAIFNQAGQITSYQLLTDGSQQVVAANLVQTFEPPDRVAPVLVVNPEQVGGGGGSPSPSGDIWQPVVRALADATVSGATATFTVPAGKKWQLLGATGAFASSGTAGDRRVTLSALTAGDATLITLPVGVTQAASLSYSYSWGVGFPYQTALVANTVIAPISPVMVGAGSKVQFDVSNDQTGDAWDVLTLLVAEGTL